MGLQAFLVLCYFLLALPLWVALEVVEARPGKRRPGWPAALWVVRGIALAGVAWAAWEITFGARDFWHDIWDQLQEHYPELLRGYRTTIILTLLSFALSMVLGAVLALLRTADFRVLRVIAGTYVEWFRNTPLLVQLFFLFFALPKLELPVLGRPDWFLLSPFKAGLIGLTMYTAAYTAEALRSGLLSIDKGQTEAARSIGLNYIQTRVYVVAPQALRVAVPLLTSIFSALFRNSALVSAIGVTELLQTADNIQQDNFQTFELFTLAGVLYLSLTLPLAYASNRLERRVARAR
ncbi:MAG: amino acid ABC transporter permease [Dehalococcoidia bacterium]